MTAARSQWLWDALHDLFDTHDGTLPEIRVEFADPEALLSACALLQRNARTIRWRFSSAALTVREAASIVVAGGADAEAFHVLFEGVEVGGVALPDLGVFVFHDQLALDYRMGAEWTPDRLAALFDLLVELTEADPRASLSLEDAVPSEVKARFERRWQHWRAQSSR